MRAPAQQAAADGEKEGEAMGKRPILIIDDDPRVCELVTSILAGGGLKVLTAPDGGTGIETARAVQPAVILLDMMMPGMDGIETCEHLKRDPGLQDIPVVGITASTDLQYTVKAFRAGATFFLPKPFGLESLAQVVDLAVEAAQPKIPMQGTRRYPRFPAELPVWCLIGRKGGAAREVRGRTQNVALGGLLLLLPEQVEPGAVLRLCLGFPQGPITADGTVMWHGPQPTDEGKTPHGIRLLRFTEDTDLVQYRRFLSEIATNSEVQTPS